MLTRFWVPLSRRASRFTLCDSAHLNPRKGPSRTFARLRHFTTYLDRSFNFFQTSNHYRDVTVFQAAASSPSLLSKAAELLRSQDPGVRKLPEDLDRALAALLKGCTSGKEALQLANAWLGRLLHGDVRQSLFYRQLVSSANDRWIDSSSTHPELVFWSFLLSRGKSEAESVRGQRRIFERFKADAAALFHQLDGKEVSILCNGWFAADVPLLSRPMAVHVDRLLRSEIAEKLTGLANPDLLPMLKLLRMAGFATDQLMDATTAALSDPSAQQLNLAQATHALALLADHRYGPVKKELVENVLKVIQAGRGTMPFTPGGHIHPARGTRVKDLARILWALTSLHPSPASDGADLLSEELVRQVEEGWVGGHLRGQDGVYLMSDIFLSLACWATYPEALISKVVLDRSFIIPARKDSTIRQSRLALFLIAAGIEAPHLTLLEPFRQEMAAFRHLPRRSKTRQALQSLADSANSQSEALGWKDVRLCSLIPHLNIAGLSFTHQERQVAVEVLDPSVCMRHSQEPDRLLSLKIRLLKSLGYLVVQVPNNEPDGLAFIRNNLP